MTKLRIIPIKTLSKLYLNILYLCEGLNYYTSKLSIFMIFDIKLYLHINYLSSRRSILRLRHNESIKTPVSLLGRRETVVVFCQRILKLSEFEPVIIDDFFGLENGDRNVREGHRQKRSMREL